MNNREQRVSVRAGAARGGRDVTFDRRHGPLYALTAPERHRWRMYGVSPSAWADLIAYQSGQCALCKRVPSDSDRCMDHDHYSGEVRGMLCHACNKRLSDSRIRLGRVALHPHELAYLANPPAAQVPAINRSRSVKSYGSVDAQAFELARHCDK